MIRPFSYLSPSICPVITAAYRSPLTKANKGGLRNAMCEEILTQLYKKVLDSTKIDPGLIEEVAIGTIDPDLILFLKMAGNLAGFPDTVPCYVVNRTCGSGLLSVNSIANSINAEEIEIGIAGGIDLMSKNADILNPKPPANNRYTDFLKQMPAHSMRMGETSDLIIARFGVTKEKMNTFAANSHKNALFAQQHGYFDSEIVPINTQVFEDGVYKNITVNKDDGIRSDFSFERLMKLRSAFKANIGTTLGNSSQVTDGAAILLLASQKSAEKYSLPVLGRWLGYSTVGVPPDIMGVGPLYAIPKVLKKVGLRKEDISVFEINEAFASQAVYCIEQLGLDFNKVNPNGGAIALGHPLGCSGSRMIATLLPELRRRKARYGVVSMCIGTGMGSAAVIENLIL